MQKSRQLHYFQTEILTDLKKNMCSDVGYISVICFVVYDHMQVTVRLSSTL